MHSSPSLEAFTAQFVFRFIFTGGFCFLASSIPFVLALLERFESQLTETASLCLDLQLSHRSPSQNRYRCHSIHLSYRSKSLPGDPRTTSHLPSNSISTGLSIAINS